MELNREDAGEMYSPDDQGEYMPEADIPGISWNTGMVLHILKGDPMLQDLEHVQVDGPGTTYLFL